MHLYTPCLDVHGRFSSTFCLYFPPRVFRSGANAKVSESRWMYELTVGGKGRLGQSLHERAMLQCHFEQSYPHVGCRYLYQVVRVEKKNNSYIVCSSAAKTATVQRQQRSYSSSERRNTYSTNGLPVQVRHKENYD